MYEYPSVISYVRESIHKEKEMSNIKSIFSRATIRGVADYLLFGNGPDEDSRDYEERIEEIYLGFEKTVSKYDLNPTSELLDLCNELTSETASVYMEIGVQVGILLMQDMGKMLKERRRARSNYYWR